MSASSLDIYEDSLNRLLSDLGTGDSEGLLSGSSRDIVIDQSIPIISNLGTTATTEEKRQAVENILIKYENAKFFASLPSTMIGKLINLNMPPESDVRSGLSGTEQSFPTISIMSVDGDPKVSDPSHPPQANSKNVG